MDTSILRPTVALKTEDGSFEVIGQLEQIEVEEYEDTNLLEYQIVQHQNLNCEMNISPIQITRKKFIKLLMARGIQRNGANEIAKYFLKKRGYYSMVDLIMF